MGVNVVVDLEDKVCQANTLLAVSYEKWNLSRTLPWPPQRHMRLDLKMWEVCFLNIWQSIPFKGGTFLFGRIL